MIVYRRWKWHKHSRRAHRRNLGHGTGAGAADHQISLSKRPGRVLNKGGELSLHRCSGIVGTQGIDLPAAALVQHLRPLRRLQQSKGAGHDVIEGARTQAAAQHQQLEHAAAPDKAFARFGYCQKSAAQGVAHPDAPAEHLGKGTEDAVGHPGQHPVGQAGDRILLMQHQGLAPQHTHHAARKADKAAEPHQHIGFDSPHHLEALPKSPQQAQRQQGQGQQAFAAHTRKINRLKGKPLRRHQFALHAGLLSSAASAQPVHPPTSLAQSQGQRQSGENMPPGAPGHDERGALRWRDCGAGHRRPPCMSWRFSWSMRSTRARAIRLSKMAEPP